MAAKFKKVKYRVKRAFLDKEILQIRANRMQYGDRCPFCGSSSLEGEGVDVGHREASQECHCHRCDAVWKDWYTYKTLVIIQ